jgi:aspartate aminotransferase
MRPYTIFIDGISKSFAATGVRVGWSMGPAHLVAKMKAINSHVGAWSPMAEQYATAAYLQQDDAIADYFKSFKAEIAIRLHTIYKGLMALKADGFPVDAVAPQAAIYLTIQINLVGKTTADGELLQTQAAVTAYLLNQAHLAIVPFSAFGAPAGSTWYRLSVGTCVTAQIPAMLATLREAMEKLS